MIAGVDSLIVPVCLIYLAPKAHLASFPSSTHSQNTPSSLPIMTTLNEFTQLRKVINEQLDVSKTIPSSEQLNTPLSFVLLIFSLCRLTYALFLLSSSIPLSLRIQTRDSNPSSKRPTSLYLKRRLQNFILWMIHSIYLLSISFKPENSWSELLECCSLAFKLLQRD